MIPQSFIQDLLARVDIVDVVGRHVELRRGGANWMGLCPFHGEQSPSFSVSPTKQFYHCFGCGVHGSAIDFLMSFSGYGFVEAIKELAQGLGLQVPEERGPLDPAAQAARARAPDLLDTLAQAAQFYTSRLKDSPGAIEYLKRRGLTGQTAKKFRLGYAPAGWRALEGAFANYGEPALVEAGLVIDSPAEDGDSRGARRYDRFRDRVMFPIRNARGQVVGFGGRVLGAGEPKYLNSPETPLFSKGMELYGLYEARDGLRRLGGVVVVEGYMDVVMLAQHGIDNAVATLGTATTADHVRVLARLVNRITFAFDGDAAGRKAAWRALEASLPHASDTRRIDFLFLPAQHDPDSFVREFGPPGWQGALAEATPLSEYLLRELSARVDLGSAEGRAQLQAQARSLLLALPAAALRQQLLRRLAALVELPVEELARFYGISEAGPVRQRPAQRTVNVKRAPTVTAVARAFGLAALHPALAFEIPLDPTDRTPGDVGVDWVLSAEHGNFGDRVPLAAEQLPQEILQWLHRLRSLPPGATFASVRLMCAGELTVLDRLDAAIASPWSALELDEARPEFHRALVELVLSGMQEQAAHLAGTGLIGPGDHARYQELQRRLTQIKTAYGRVRR